jgi:hypothetical protein
MDEFDCDEALRIEHLRVARRVTIAALAHAIGITEVAYCRKLLLLDDEFSRDELKRLSRALDPLDDGKGAEVLPIPLCSYAHGGQSPVYEVTSGNLPLPADEGYDTIRALAYELAKRGDDGELSNDEIRALLDSSEHTNAAQHFGALLSAHPHEKTRSRDLRARPNLRAVVAAAMNGCFERLRQWRDRFMH